MVDGTPQNTTSASTSKSSKLCSSCFTSKATCEGTPVSLSPATSSSVRALPRLMMVIFLISSPRRIRASRICHLACAPAPKTTMFSVLFLSLYNKILPSAVLNAVISAAFNTPTALPPASHTVRVAWSPGLGFSSGEGGLAGDMPTIFTPMWAGVVAGIKRLL